MKNNRFVNLMMFMLKYIITKILETQIPMLKLKLFSTTEKILDTRSHSGADNGGYTWVG